MSNLDEIRKECVYRLAERADCGQPDDHESPGAKLLDRVRGEACQAWEDGHGSDDSVHEIADDAPSVYTHERWQQFLDLTAYQEEPELGEWPSDLTDAAGIALYQIADRLARSIMDELDTLAEGDDDES